VRAPLSLISWNVLADVHITPAWYPRVPDADLHGPLRRARVLDRLTELDADVMVLQEVAPELLDGARARFPDHGLAFASRPGEGLAVLVRGHQPWSRVLPLPGRTARALEVTLPGDVRLVNVHLKWSGDPVPGRPRAGVDQLRCVLDYGPDIVAGDFNAFPDWPERQLATERGWRDVGPQGPTCNVHARLQPLDTVLIRGDLRAEVLALPTIDRHTPMPSPDHPSDHLPVQVRLFGLPA
jgi:endonuclease/exonuclease/phosphatase family metal-dependent hydrolase